MTARRRLEALILLGFDQSRLLIRNDAGAFTNLIMIRCSQCQAATIDGVAVHESGCRNNRRAMCFQPLARNQAREFSSEDRTMANMLQRFVSEDQGQDLIEYALLAGFISLTAVVAITAVGVGVNSVYNNIDSTVQGIPGAGS